MKAGFGSAAGAPGGNPHFVPPAVPDMAKLFPQLEVLGLVGHGGMGAVYKARQPSLDRFIAIKILPPESTVDPGFAERFSREARALARLNHPNIVSVYDFGKAGDLHYFLMEYVDGVNLRQLVQAGRLSPREALEIVPQICEALQFAHDEGIVHRDIKPENVMLDKRGRVKITDFGLAKLLGREPETLQLTGVHDVMGTAHYMAPEQMEKPNAVDHRADIYSLGVVFYELLTGELPLGKFAPPSRKVAVDVRLDEVVLHALEKEPERRYQKASEVKTDVEAIAHSAFAVPPPIERKPAEVSKVEDAFRQVRGPAMGLIVTGILNWVTIPILALATIYLVARTAPGGSKALLALPVAALGLSSLILVGALKMKRLQGYWLAVVATLTAMLITPGNLVGLPVGIWSLVVLSQKRVRDSFGTDLPLPAATPGNSSWKTAAIIVGALLLVLAVPVGAIVASITLPALSRVKAIQDYSRQFDQVRQVSLHNLRLRAPGEGMDLDANSVDAIPREVLDAGDDNAIANYVLGRGCDLMLSTDEGGTALLTPRDNELKLSPVPNAVWERPSQVAGSGSPIAVVPETISQVVRGAGPWVAYILAAGEQPPLTFSFETAKGTRGLLQISSLGGDPPVASIRYKKYKP